MKQLSMNNFDSPRFSAMEFEKCGFDSEDSKSLLDELEAIMAKDIHEILSTYLIELVESLNKTGHNLKLEESVYDRKDYPIDITYRDDWKDSDGYHCKLRLAVTNIISTGYPHLIKKNE